MPCPEVAVEHVWVMETGMERCHSAVSDEKLGVVSYLPPFFFTIGHIVRNIALLVLSILSWVLSLILTVFAAVALKKEITLKERSLINFLFLPLWSKITYIILLAIEFLFLVVVLLLWIIAGVIPDSANSSVPIIIL
jgi:hypothetical protein